MANGSRKVSRPVKAGRQQLGRPAEGGKLSRETQIVTVIGLTGPFGSGCSTASKTLRDERKFKVVKLSEPILAQWRAAGGRGSPRRVDLQRIGDELREGRGSGILVELSLGALRQSERPLPALVVVDGIRNLGEIQVLRDWFGYRFWVMAVLASHQERWDRIGATAYKDVGLDKDSFLEDDLRDANEETQYGQQVQLCIDQADVLIDNSSSVTLTKFKQKVLECVDLVTGKLPRVAKPQEILMNMAYSASHSSKCLKRHVGAVIVDNDGGVVGVGYNENPLGTNPCVEEPKYGNRCYRDIVRNEHFGMLRQKRVRCPRCGEALEVKEGPPWRCEVCARRGEKTNLEEFFFPDRAMTWCTAVHAEIWAVLAAGKRSRGGHLYTTTFPCFQCAEKLAQAGIKRVCYTEAYPDVKSRARLEIAGITVEQFEGVRSASFERIFSSRRPT
jgi:deoxycytidylate deaminase/dephospho-CoA kinase